VAVLDTAPQTRLEVTFFGLIKTVYCIIDIDPDHQWAVIGDGGGKYLWVLNRQPQMKAATYADICARLREKQYDPASLFKTPQPKDDLP
jgi:lipocalin